MDSNRPVWPDLVAATGPLAGCAVLTAWWMTLPPRYLVEVAALYVGFALVILRTVPCERPGRGLGAANRVTLVRATLVLPLAALPFHSTAADARALWWIIAVAGIAMALDGVDGWVARRYGATAFGARFDMELDAVLLLALSILVLQTGKVGPWVLVIGSLRYAFVLAGGVWPCLQDELPPRWRRKAGCVVQGAALLFCLLPMVAPAAAAVVAGLAATGLVISFAIDVVWLVSHASPTRDHA